MSFSPKSPFFQKIDIDQPVLIYISTLLHSTPFFKVFKGFFGIYLPFTIYFFLKLEKSSKNHKMLWLRQCRALYNVFQKYFYACIFQGIFTIKASFIGTLHYTSRQEEFNEIGHDFLEKHAVTFLEKYTVVFREPHLEF